MSGRDVVGRTISGLRLGRVVLAPDQASGRADDARIAFKPIGSFVFTFNASCRDRDFWTVLNPEGCISEESVHLLQEQDVDRAFTSNLREY